MKLTGNDNGVVLTWIPDHSPWDASSPLQTADDAHDDRNDDDQPHYASYDDDNPVNMTETEKDV